MTQIPRHAADPELLQEGLDWTRELFATLRGAQVVKASDLSIDLSTARNHAGYLAASQARTAELCAALRTGAQLSAAIFALAAGTGNITFPLGEHLVTLPATGPSDATHAGNWRTGWWMAHIVRDRAAIDLLASTPVDVLHRSSSRGDACQYLFIEALQGFARRAPDWSNKLQAALDATDPAQTNLADEDFVLNIVVPEMELLFRLGLAENAPFTEALTYALTRHKAYWSTPERKRDPHGYLALGPLALASLAFDAGMPIGAVSDYLPRDLLENGAAGG